MNSFSVGLSAAIGGLAAILMDLFNKKDASSVFELTSFVNQLASNFTSQAIPVGGVGVGLIILAVMLAYLQEARNRMAAFYSGASVLTVLMTLVPYNAPLPAPTGATVNQVSSADGFQLIGGAHAAEAPLLLAQGQTQIPVTIIVTLAPSADGTVKAQYVRGMVKDLMSGRRWALPSVSPKPSGSSGAVFRYQFFVEGTPGNSKGVANLQLSVTADGYQTKDTSPVLVKGGQAVTLEATLQPSAVPRFLQRTLESPR